MKKQLTTTTSIVLMMIMGCTPSHTVVQVEGGIPRQGADPGIYYALPETVVTIKVPVTKTVYEAGEYICYADKYGLEVPEVLQGKKFKELRNPSGSGLSNDKIMECTKTGEKTPPDEQYFRTKSTAYKLGAPEVKTHARPDVSQIFRVEILSAFRQSRELLVELSEMGLMTVGESSASDKTLDYVVATIKAVSRGLAAAYSAPGGKDDDALKWKASDDGRAQEIALSIGTIRQMRRELITGRTSQGLTTITSDLFDKLLVELDKEEERLLANFWSKSTGSAYALVEFVPSENLHGQDIEVFTIDPTSGLGAASNVPPGVSVVLPEGFGPGADSKRVLVSVHRQVPEQFTSVVSSSQHGNAPYSGGNSNHELGFRYRVPALARLEVGVTDSPATGRTSAVTLLGTSDILVSQLGAVVALPAKLKSLDSKFAVKLYEQTGALKSAGVKSTAIDPALIDKLGDAAENFGKAESARRAMPDKESPLKRATDKLGEFQTLIKTLGAMGLPVPAWAIEEVASGDAATDGTNPD